MRERRQMLLAGGAVLFVVGVAMVLGLNAGRVPLVWTGVAAAVVGGLVWLAAAILGPVRAPDPDAGLLMAGWFLVVMLPIGGLIVGGILLARNRAAHGVGMLLASTAAAVTWSAIVWAMVA